MLETVRGERRMVQGKIIHDQEKPKSNLVRNLLLFFALLTLTMWILFKDENPKTIVKMILDNDVRFVLAGFVSILLYHFLESVNLRLTLYSMGQKIGPVKALKFTIIGAFFSGVTPAATGGQPMEIYYMHKEKIPVGTSTLALLLNLIGYQTATLSYGIIGFFCNLDRMEETPALFAFFFLGIGLNLMAFALLLIGVYSPKMSHALVRGCIHILRFFKIKKADKLSEKFEQAFDKYKDCTDYLKSHPFLLIRVILLAMIQFAFYYAVAYWAYRALGFSGTSMLRIMSLQALVFAIVSGIPSPGAVGVSEGAFIAVFGKVYSKAVVKSATLLTRIMNFYFVIILGAFVVIGSDIRLQRRWAREAKQGAVES